MKKIFPLLLFPLSLNAQINTSIGTGYTQQKIAVSASIGYEYKNFNIALQEVIPLTNSSSRHWIFQPRLGYRVGNFVPYATYKGGGLAVKRNNLFFDIGMQEKYSYVTIGTIFPTVHPEKIGNELLVYSLCFISGMANGTREAIQFHYKNGVLNNFPGIDQHFTDPQISWQNKNKNWITQTVPTFSDLYHLTGALERVPLIVAIALSTNNLNWKAILKKAVIGYAANRLGHYLTYSVMFKTR